MGRYVAEERDSGRLFRSCYEKLRENAPEAVGAPKRSAALAADLRSLGVQTCAVSEALENLRRDVSELQG